MRPALNVRQVAALKIVSTVRIMRRAPVHHRDGPFFAGKGETISAASVAELVSLELLALDQTGRVATLTDHGRIILRRIRAAESSRKTYVAAALDATGRAESTLSTAYPGFGHTRREALRQMAQHGSLHPDRALTGKWITPDATYKTAFAPLDWLIRRKLAQYRQTKAYGAAAGVVEPTAQGRALLEELRKLGRRKARLVGRSGLDALPAGVAGSRATESDTPTLAMVAAHAYTLPTAEEWERDPPTAWRDYTIDQAWRAYQAARDPTCGPYDILHDPAWLAYEAARNATWDTWRQATGGALNAMAGLSAARLAAARASTKEKA